MSFHPKDALQSAKEIATNAIEKSSDIVEHAGHIIKGDIADGVSGIVHSSLDIATHATDKVKEMVTGKKDKPED